MSDRCLCSTGHFFPHRKENCALSQALRIVGLSKPDVTIPVDEKTSESVDKSIPINYVTSSNVEIADINLSDIVMKVDSGNDSADGVQQETRRERDRDEQVRIAPL